MARRAIKPFPVDLAPPPFHDTDSVPPAIFKEWQTLIEDARTVTTFETGRFAVHSQCRRLYYCGDTAFGRMWKAYGENHTATAEAIRERPQTFGRLAHKHGPERNIPPHHMGDHYADILLPLLQRAHAHEAAKPRIEARMAALLATHPPLAEHPPRHHQWSKDLKEAMWLALATHPRRETLMAGNRPRSAFTQEHLDAWRARFKDDPLLLSLLPKHVRRAR